MRIIYRFIFLLFILSGHTLYAQHNYWDDLAKVTIQEKTDENGFPVEYPVFSDDLMKMNGHSIELQGYMVPLDEMRGHHYFVLSALPFNMCFFCGAAGPETVIEVYTKDDVSFTSEKIKMKGELYINEDDPRHLMYMLKQAEKAD